MPPSKIRDWTNVSGSAQTLASGRPLAPGETAESDMTDPHDRALRDEGHLVPTETDEGKN
jgi:hypothetical protein